MGSETHDGDDAEDCTGRVRQPHTCLPSGDQPRCANQADELDQAKGADGSEPAQLLRLRRAALVGGEEKGHVIEGGGKDREHIDREPRGGVVLGDLPTLCHPRTVSVDRILHGLVDHTKLQNHVQDEDEVEQAIDHKPGVDGDARREKAYLEGRELRFVVDTRGGTNRDGKECLER